MTASDGGSGRRTLGSKLTAQAKGSKRLEGAAIVLTKSPAGQRLQRSLPLEWENETEAKIDWSAARAMAGLSPDEQKALALADSLATGQPVDLSDVLTGVDPTTATVIVEAISHATDSAR